MKQQVIRFSVAQSSKVVALLYGAMGLIFVPIGLLLAVLDQDGTFGTFMIAFYLCAPFFYAVIGYIAALLGFWVYNLIAGGVGGIEMELVVSQQTEAMGPVADSGQPAA